MDGEELDRKLDRVRFRDNPEAMAAYLTEAIRENDLKKALSALNRVFRAQNVQAMARQGDLRRDRLYKTFGGQIDPQLGRVMDLFAALRLRFRVEPLPSTPIPERPKVGRPRKVSKQLSNGR